MPESLSAHAKETLWIGFLCMALLYAAMARLDGIHGQAGLYGQLADAFLSGHTYLKEPPPAHLLHAPDPYMVRRGTPDMQYSDYLLYNEHFYLPYGPAPALFAFAPYKYVTGRDLNLTAAVFAFACIGTATLVLLYRRLALALGVYDDQRFRAATFLLIAGAFVPIGIALPARYQVALAGSYACAALALWCLLATLQKPRSLIYPALCGLCLGLAAGCRLHFVFAGIILALPALYWLRENRWRPSAALCIRLLCLGLPWLCCITGLLWYNDARFGSIFNTGIHYQISWKHWRHAGAFSASRILANLYFFFLNPIPLKSTFPFFNPMQCCRQPMLLPWHTTLDLSTQEPTYGALTNAPFLWFAYASLKGLRRLPAAPALTISACWGVALAVLPVLLIMDSATRYLVDFVPWLMLAACIGYARLATEKHRPWLIWLARALMVWTLAAGLVYGAIGPVHVTYARP